MNISAANFLFWVTGWMKSPFFFLPRIKIKKNMGMRVSFQNHWSHFSSSKLVFSREDNMGRIKSLMTRLSTKKIWEGSVGRKKLQRNLKKTELVRWNPFEIWQDGAGLKNWEGSVDRKKITKKSEEGRVGQMKSIRNLTRWCWSNIHQLTVHLPRCPLHHSNASLCQIPYPPLPYHHQHHKHRCCHLFYHHLHHYIHLAPLT